MGPDRTCSLEGLEKMDFFTLTSQNKTVNPMKGNLIMLLDDFYYGQHRRDGQTEQKTCTAFKCLSCSRVLKNVKLMTQVKNHVELERQKGDRWKTILPASTTTASFPPRSSCSVTLKVSMLPGSPPWSVISVNCPSEQIRFSYST